MQNYELLFILPGTLAENETQPTVDKVKMMIERNGGTDIEVTPMDKKRLAYPMRQIRYGYFYTIIFSAETKELKALQTKLGLLRDLLRAIISVYNPSYTPASKMSFTTTITGANRTNEETVEVEKSDKPAEKPADKKVSIQEIDKKLEEILSGEIISGV